ncbi:efflux RND transporter periplasmic adaptor subunit [Kineococcus sp. SYSU DK004]|uniref:hypothetical protein n=1 Tax=Kineococcus sp. SYSU DK004 TaxID=3383125 RepID=UPI003D7F0A40
MALHRGRAASAPGDDELLRELAEDPADTDTGTGPDDAAPARARARREQRGPRTGRAAAVLRRNRTLLAVAAAAAVSLVVGLLLGRSALGPAQAQGVPEPGLITAPVAYGELSNDVVIRGEVAYSDAVEVRVDTSSVPGPPVVTGRVPAPGDELVALSIALEVAGRPVIVLPGELPAYRTLQVGVSGPDVVQFKQALRAVGLDGGDPSGDVFDARAAAAVTRLYEQAGYPAPESAEGAADGVRAAQEGVRGAEQALAAARADLERARSGADPVEVREADNAVASARRAVDSARAQDPAEPDLVADLEDALGLAQLRRAQLDAPADTSAQRAAVTAAEQQLRDARDALAEAREQALPSLPAGEVLYLSGLPRRVDATSATRGGLLEGPAMTVSGAALRVSGSAAEADARLLAVGAEAFLDLPDGSTHRAVVAAVAPGEDDSSRWRVDLDPDPFTPQQVSELQGANVRVSLPVGATQGPVLSVPLAALSAGAGGESRVEVVEGDPRAGDDARTRLVVVETGLAADGAVEVSAPQGGLAEGDLVVVGR